MEVVLFSAFALLLVFAGPIFLTLWLRERRDRKLVMSELAALQAKYAPITDIESDLKKLEAERAEVQASIEPIRIAYAEKRNILDALQAQIAVFDDRLAFAEMGIYEPHFDFTDAEQFKIAIEKARENQKALVRDKLATECPREWTVEGSAAKGAAMINRQTRLTLRSFNAACDAAISNARWNNVNAMEKRILTAADQINKDNSSLYLKITDEYIKAKLEELRITHEYREFQKAEKEERSEMVRAEREEKKLLAEAEAAEREERKYQTLLDKAKAEASANGETAAMSKRIAELEAALVEAHSTSERARAMAEMTKSGYVYIISNVGSFGEDVVKIGLTRRLDPDDRIRELGDASVPFGFDVHAMIYSDAAPDLESALHKEFADRRINISNLRKEFFKVALDEVETAVAKLAPTASFFKDREAQEWHETLAKRNQLLSDMQRESDRFPKAI